MVDCAWCATPFPASGRRRYDTDACRQAAYRARHHTRPAATQPTYPDVERTVYECPGCEQRYLAQRRCPECNLFCRRIGTGGSCPACDEPVAHSDLDS